MACAASESIEGNATALGIAADNDGLNITSGRGTALHGYAQSSRRQHQDSSPPL
jgi:hypothetical protein